MQTAHVRQSEDTADNNSFFKRWYYWGKQWLYRGQRAHLFVKILNRMWADTAAKSAQPNGLVALEVIGRKSGRVISFPLVMAVVDGQRYLASMLGGNAQWVQNVRAAGGKAVLRRGGREEVCLEEVPANQRAALLKAYLQVAPGARPHIPVSEDAPIEEFEKIAEDFPVFRLVSILSEGQYMTGH